MPAAGDNCGWILDRIEAYVDDELVGGELNAFEAHIGSCRSCREELDLARSLVHELRSLPPLECPESVVAEAAARAGAEGGRRSWAARLRDWFGRLTVPVPKPAMAAMVVVIVAVSVFVLTQHERSLRNSPPELRLTQHDAEVARVDVMLAFAYVGKYSRRTGQIIKKDVIEDRVMKPVGKSVAEPMYPFPLGK